ncbi:hypothetical protein Dvina_46065 [Dactylosporangium vinaceum]|uniref:Uncharacterized protein n=1 Tax=Dactylosporangium vinaceum TaxID=53362 RepID=A0ABV5M7B9_9ACTN|nr:hypothetical protein [Dactylosporangium vinaceum]UAB95324.1 hypothetical protein Dvina_46065 [Dactylosporangium vinaceum]
MRRILRAALLTTTLTAAASVVVSSPADAAEPHYNLTPAFIAYTDATQPKTTTFYPTGDLPVGTNTLIDQKVHKTRVYFGFDVNGVQRARLSSSHLVLSDRSSDCTKPKSLYAQPTNEFAANNTWQKPPKAAGSAVRPVFEGSGCLQRVTFDLTAGLDKALAVKSSRLWVEVAVPDVDESRPTSGQWLGQNDFHLQIELTNKPPDKPVKTRYDSALCSAGTHYSASDFTVYADQSDPDTNPSDGLKSEIEYWPAADPAHRTAVTTFQGSGGDGVFGFGSIPGRTLAEGAYAWHARTYDGRAYSPWSADCAFVIDRTAPNVPTVSSVEFPENPPAPTGGPAVEGTFVVGPNGSTDVVGYRYGGRFGGTYVAANPDGTATFKYRPFGVGPQTLTVTAYDRAGNSAQKQYQMNVRDVSVSAWSIAQVPDPASSGVIVTMHFTSQVGSGLTRVRYSADGGEVRTATFGADGIVDAPLPALRMGEHELTWTGLDDSGTEYYTVTSYFFVVDEPSVESDGVYPIEGSGGGVGQEGVFTVSPFNVHGAQSVEYSTSQDSTHVLVPVDADGRARIHWTPAESGSTYFYVAVRYADGTISTYHSFSVTVN